MKYKILIYNNAANNILQVFHKYQQKNILKNKKMTRYMYQNHTKFFLFLPIYLSLLPKKRL